LLSDMIGILIATLMSIAAPAPSSELLEPFEARPTRSDAEPPSDVSDLIDPFSVPPRRTTPIDCSEPTLRDPFGLPSSKRRTDEPFPGLRDPFAY
jgi:hypothetical protein